MFYQYTIRPKRTKRETFTFYFAIFLFFIISIAGSIGFGFWLGETKPGLLHGGTEELSLNLPTKNKHQGEHSQMNDLPIVSDTQQPNWKYTSLNEEIRCLTENIYFESNNQPLRGQIAVGLVTINRVRSNRYPNNICQVVWQKKKDRHTGQQVAQFSWTQKRKVRPGVRNEKWQQANRIAQTLLAGGSLRAVRDFTKGSTHFHADYVRPQWSREFTKTVVIGKHIFYRDEDAMLAVAH